MRVNQFIFWTVLFFEVGGLTYYFVENTVVRYECSVLLFVMYSVLNKKKDIISMILWYEEVRV